MATNQARKFDATRVIDIEVRDVNDDVPRFVKPNPDNAIAYVLEVLLNCYSLRQHYLYSKH